MHVGRRPVCIGSMLVLRCHSQTGDCGSRKFDFSGVFSFFIFGFGLLVHYDCSEGVNVSNVSVRICNFTVTFECKFLT